MLKVNLNKVNPNNDVLMVDKPVEWSSHDVVAKIRGELSKKSGQKVKVGHGGTLDPFATGVLLVLVGKATGKFEMIKSWEKEYLMEIKMGELTDTGDRTGRVIKKETVRAVSKKEVKEVLSSFKGEIMQQVPVYSAVKVKGKRLFQYARKGLKVKLPKKKVKIRSIKLVELNGDCLKLRVICGSGTYMRQLAVDIGAKLKLPAHVYELRRLRIGSYRVKIKI